MITGEADLLTGIKRQLPALSEGQARIARFIIERPDEAKDIALADLCRHCRTSEPVVFAFCAALGLDGFRALKTSLAETLGARRSRGTDGQEGLAADADLLLAKDSAELLRGLGRLYRNAIAETLTCIDVGVFDRAVSVLDAAKRMVVLGVGVSGNTGFVALQNFLRTGTPVSWVTDPNMFFTHLAPLEKGDACIVLSQMGNQRDVVEGAVFARSRKAAVIAITSDGTGPLAEVSDMLLLTAPDGIDSGTHASIGAQLATPVLFVADALAVALFARRQDAWAERSRATAAANARRTLPRRRRNSGKSKWGQSEQA